MVKIYKQPFAHDGDAIAIPDASQPDGKMSSADGWTPDYQLPKTDPNYKPVGRQEMNGVFKEVTEALGQVQVQGAASWAADGAPYPINAQLYHNGKQWLALRANSVAPTDGADWAAIGTAAIRDVTTSSTDTTAGRVLKVGDFGIGGNNPRVNSFDANDLLPGQRRSWSDSFTEADAVSVNLPALGGGPTSARAWHVESMGSESSRAVQYATENFGSGTTRGRTFIRVKHDATWHPWQEIIRTSSLLQATGSSTAFPMSQKSVSDQLIGVGKTWSNVTATRAWDTEYTNTKGRTLPIAVIVRDTAGGNLSAKLFIDGELHSEVYTSASFTQTLCADIPDGSTYELKRTDNNDAIISWMEL